MGVIKNKKTEAIASVEIFIKKLQFLFIIIFKDLVVH